MKHWKLDIDMNLIDSAEGLEAILNAVEPDSVSVFYGLRYLMVRYDNPITAQARALDAECAAYCGRPTIEEVNA